MALSRNEDNYEYLQDVKPIYRPSTRVRGRIFAIHDPDDSGLETWTYKEPDQHRQPKAYCWLQDLGPRLFPQCAVYSINCEENRYQESWGTYKILRRHLIKTRLNERAPIILITHGFGGVVLKHLVDHLWGWKGFTSFTPQLDRLAGVIFLATVQHHQHLQSQYEQLFPDYWRHRLPKNDDETNKLNSDLESYTTEFISFAEMNRTKVLSVAPASAESYDYQIGGLSGLESTLDAAEIRVSQLPQLPKLKDSEDPRLQGIVKWLKDTFGQLLLSDPTWTATSFLLKPERPFEDGLKIPTDEILTDHGQEYYVDDRGKKIYHAEDDSKNKDYGTWLESRRRNLWIHLPENDEHSMEAAMRFFGPRPRTSGFEAKFDVIQARSGHPHTRYILPDYKWTFKNFTDPGHGALDQMEPMTILEIRIFLPYLHWDTLRGAQAYHRDMQMLISGKRGPRALKTEIPDMRNLLERLEDLGKFHPRRTLDQFYYSRMIDTRYRDADQVVTRQTKEGGLSKLIMIDQLWLCLWIPVNPHGGPRLEVSSLLTAFPHTSYARTKHDPKDLFDTADIRQDVFEANLTTVTAVDVTGSVLKSALLGPLSMGEESSLDFLELFREAIGIVTQKHDKLFRDFKKSMERDATRITIKDRQQEVALGLEIADIIDELNMLQQLFRTQIAVLSRLSTKMSSENIDIPRSLEHEIRNIRDKVSDNFLVQVVQMMETSERVQKSILDLLDLQQKEESIREVKMANQQALFSAKQVMSAQDAADATEAQSWILFVFTVVTTIFLPLSFFTALGTNKAMWASGGTIAFVIAAGAGAWYFWGKHKAGKERIKWLIDLEDKGFLPPGLIEKGDDQDKQMEKMRLKQRRARSVKGLESDPATGRDETLMA